MRVAILTISDSVSQGERRDSSGPALHERCTFLRWNVVLSAVLPDDRAQIEANLTKIADSGAADLILTTGGTGLGPRDVTPEATAAVCERLVPGLGEVMREESRKSNARAVLSRAVAGVRGHTLILNLPGSPRGAVESLTVVAKLLQHALDVLHGARHD
jgi:molybdenum cofactor synthesis domain-containing protein